MIFSIVNIELIKKNPEFIIATIINKKDNGGSYNLVYQYKVNNNIYTKTGTIAFFKTEYRTFNEKKVTGCLLQKTPTKKLFIDKF